MPSIDSNSSFDISTGQNTPTNATPSPSSAKAFPTLDNSAFVEAIASLSYAADILSNASKAMSSAVESLMLASSHPECRDFFTLASRLSPPENRTQDWLSRNYSLNPAGDSDMVKDGSSLLFKDGVVPELRESLPTNPNYDGTPKEALNGSAGHPEQPLDHHSDVSELELKQSKGTMAEFNQQTSGELPSSSIVSNSQLEGMPVVTIQTLLPNVSEPLLNQTAKSTVSTSLSESSGGHITELECSCDKNTDSETQKVGAPHGHVWASSSSVRQPSPTISGYQTTNRVETTGFAIVEFPSESLQKNDTSTSGSSPAQPMRRQRSTYISQQYIVLDEDLDIIPLIAHLAEFKPRQNTLCFVEDVRIYHALESMVKEIVTPFVYMLIPGGTNGTKNAAGRACDSGDGCLIFCSSFSTPLPLAIRNKEFQMVIHVGWTNNPALYNDQLERNGTQRATLILTQHQFDEHDLSDGELQGHGYRKSPSTARLNDLTINNKMSKKRDSWKEELSDSSNYGNLCRCFEAWLAFHFSGPHERTDWSANDVGNEGNKFAKRALLHGNNKIPPRYPVHPTVGRRLSVTSQFVSNYWLEDAVKAKILVAEEFDD